MNKFFLVLTVLVFSSLFFSSCNRNKFNVDVSGVNADIRIRRMEKDFFSADIGNLLVHHNKLMAAYGQFYQRYIENITGIGLVNDPAIEYGLSAFLTDKYILELKADVEKKYNGELTDINNDLEDAFKHIRYYFPEMVVPEIVTFVSGFQYAMAVTDSTLGIGLDMYLGSDYENYPKAGLPVYKTAAMSRDYIVPDAMKAWLLTEFFSQENQQPEDMLENMIQQGKIMYLMEAALPEKHDSIITGYSKSQLDWCRNNEFNIWAHIIDNELLFSTDHQLITKLFNEAPFTSGFPKESPPKLGIWIGWQIVRSFMENNSNTTLPELMQLRDAKQILNKSKYKPKK